MNRFSTLLFLLVYAGGSALAQQIIHIDGKAALLGPPNTVYTSGFDSIVEDSETLRESFFTFYKGGKQGVVLAKDLDKTDWSSFTCRHDQVRPVYYRTRTNSLYIVRNAGRYGLINNEGAEIVPIQHDSVYQERTYSKIILIRRTDGKLDFLDIATDIDSAKALTFPYDEVYSDTKRRDCLHLRTERKYGFYYSYRSKYAEKYKSTLIAPVFEAPIREDGFFLTATKGSERHYFYEKQLLWNTFETDLYLADRTFFNEIETGSSMLVAGNNRTERSLLTYEYLYTSIDQTQAIPCYNLRTLEAVPVFEAGYGKTYDYETLLLDYWDVSRKDSMRVHLVRVTSYNGFSPVESFYTLNKPQLILTAEMREGQTVRLAEYDRNWHYITVEIVSARPDEKGHYKSYDMKGYLHASRFEMQTDRPPHEDGNFAERWKKNHGGGGGGSGWNWLWMGGR
jgi:hypothetical protein